MSELKWQEDVEISPDQLDVEWCKQASLFGKYCVEQAAFRDTADRLKEKLEVNDAGLGLKIRSSPPLFGLDKVTEASVQAVILLDKEHTKLSDELATARYQLEVMSAAVRALDQKKSALENLVRLQGQNYFAGPSVPRDIGAAWVKETERHGARDAVKRKLNRGG